MLEPRTESEEPNHNPIFDPFKSMNNNQRDYWKSGSFGRTTAVNYQNRWNLNGEGVEFRPPQSSGDESGVHSPPLWQSSSPPRDPENYRTLSPTSRTQAIARGQRELMEMVKNMPESCYELSLKDLVEHHHHNPPRIGSPKEESYLLEDRSCDDDGENREQVLKQRAKSIRRQESKNCDRKAQILRSGSMENRDLFLKMMVFPFSFKSKKKKNPITRVSPKPEGSDKTSKPVDKDWWKKRFGGSSGSESGITSSNNSGSTGSSGSSSIHSRSSSSRKKMGFFRSCFSCFYPSKSSNTSTPGDH